jgi:hypothetical protein
LGPNGVDFGRFIEKMCVQLVLIVLNYVSPKRSECGAHMRFFIMCARILIY